MQNKRLYFALSMAICINLAIFVETHNRPTLWELGENQLKTGTADKGRIEHLNLLSIAKVKETSPSSTKYSQPPSPKKVALKKKTDAIPKSLVTNNDQINPIKNEISSNDSNASKAEASPQITQAAKLQSSPPPLNYPPEAIARNAYGKVKVKATVTNDGHVENIQVIVSSGYKILDEEAIKWFSKLTFQPALSGNTQIASTVIQTISFNLNTSDS